MPNPVPIEPMDSYLCVLLKLNLIQTTVVYSQGQICTIISNNQSAFDAIYDDPQALTAARTTYMSDAQGIVIVDKREDCG